MNIYESIRTAILGNATLSGIVSTRVFRGKPNTDQTDSYIQMIVQDEPFRDVSSLVFFRIICFSKDASELYTMKEELISTLSGKQNLGGSTNMYKARVTNRSDSPERLRDGFYWTLLFFEFYRTR